MALRRELLPILLAAALLLIGPGQALAAPQWLGAETRDAAGGPPDVTTDADGNSAAVWIGEGGEVNAAIRPRGGPWSPAENLEPAGQVQTEDNPLVIAEPDGEFVAVWVGDAGGSFGNYIRWAHRPPGGDWSEPANIAQATAGFAGLIALEVGAGGDVTVLWTQGDGFAPSTNTKLPGGDAWGPSEPVPAGSNSLTLAAAPDGSAAVAYLSGCGEGDDCVFVAYRPPGGPWSGVTETATLTAGTITGLALTARPDSSYTAIWGEDAPAGRVASADRSPGPSGAWDELSTTIADLGATAGGCTNAGSCFDLATRGTTLAAVWQETALGAGEIAASLRAGDGDWGDPETVGSSDGGGSRPQAAITAGGIAVAAWQSGTGATDAVVRGARRNGDGTWDAEDLGNASVGEGSLALGDVVADGQGDAVTAWRDDPDGTRTAGFDGAGPRFSSFSFPAGTAGSALGFSAVAADNWSSLASISWLFGDGGSAFGGAVSHAYGAAGSYAAAATATDTVGNATQQPGTVAVAAAPSPPDPCGSADTDKDGIKNGCDDNNGAERPRPFRTVNATVVSGDVFVKLPAGSASASQAKPPRGFKRLEGAETIPVGSTLDTKRGRVKIRSAADTRRKTQTGQFYRGRFVIRQARIKRRSRKLITDMRLTGSSFKSCRATTASVSQRRRKRSKRKVRRLFGDAKGSFRTSGRNAAATVRGTRWGVQDRCDGTLVAVQRGRVAVRDKVKRKTIILRRGKTYLARAR